MNWMKKTDRFLRSHGVESLIGFMISPAVFLAVSAGFGVFLTVLCRCFGVKQFAFCGIIFLLGMALPAVLLYISNESDNDNMLKDIRNLFEMLKIQLHAGIYMVDALENCCGEIENKRLLKALNRFLDEVYMSRDVAGSLEQFHQVFSNPHIDMLVIILKQSMETGQSKTYLDNASEQVIDVERALYIKREQTVERNVQVMQVLFMAGVIAICVYCSIVEFKGLFVFF